MANRKVLLVGSGAVLVLVVVVWLSMGSNAINSQSSTRAQVDQAADELPSAPTTAKPRRPARAGEQAHLSPIDNDVEKKDETTQSRAKDKKKRQRRRRPIERNEEEAEDQPRKSASEKEFTPAAI